MRRFLLVLLLLHVSFPAPGEEAKPLTLERIHSDPPIAGRSLQGGRWRDAHRYSWIVQEGAGAGARQSLHELDAASGRTTKLLDAPALLPDAARPDQPTTLPLVGYQWNPSGTALLVASGNDLWLLNVPASPAAGTPRRVVRGEDRPEFPVFSPDGSRIAFVRKHDLFTVGLETGVEARLTTTGSDHVLNGRLDWVYEEELAARRSGRSFEWAPDSRSIAYLRLDETRVPEFPIVDFAPVHGALLPQRYPKAGDPNAVPSIHVVSLDGTETAAAFPDPDDVYVGPEMAWTPDSGAVAWTLLNRAQTRVESRLLPKRGGAARTLFVETDAAWVNAIEPPRFLKDGSFLFLSERSGFLHVWRGRGDGSAPVPVTTGAWMVDRTWEVDERGGQILFVGTESHPRERHVYRIGLDGSGLQRLTPGRGFHAPAFSPGAGYFADTFSTIDTPPKTTVLRNDGTSVATVHDSKGDLGSFRVATTEFRSFHAADGTILHGRLVRPSGFDPSRRYPVIVSVYGGPHAQVVQDRWGATSLFDHLCAEKGFLVWSVDNRGSWGRGHAFETPLLRRTGEVELKDQLDGVEELRKLPFVDGSRIGIWGWSYGGYLTLYAATHAGSVFRCAAAGAPVVDWKLYDSIYAERYMKLPKDNADGYRASSPLEAADRLGTKLLLVHGTSDDNVHLQQTIAFVEALTRARKDYSLVLLPGQKHGPSDRASRLYSNQRILEFFEKNL
jgi:dipeptidyl-peptidase-4